MCHSTTVRYHFLINQVYNLTPNFSSALANGRTVNIQQQYLDQCPRILEHAGATPEDGRIVAEIQLYRIALNLQHSQHRLQFAELEYEEIERWKMEWAHLLSKPLYQHANPKSKLTTHSQQRRLNPRLKPMVLPTHPAPHSNTPPARQRPSRPRNMRQRPPNNIQIPSNPLLLRTRPNRPHLLHRRLCSPHTMRLQPLRPTNQPSPRIHAASCTERR